LFSRLPKALAQVYPRRLGAWGALSTGGAQMPYRHTDGTPPATTETGSVDLPNWKGSIVSSEQHIEANADGGQAKVAERSKATRSRVRSGRRLVAVLAVAGAGGLGLLSATSAMAQTKTFTSGGCEAWEVPTGVSSLAVDAVGAAGAAANSGANVATAPGGDGDAVSATLPVTPGQHLRVCVDQGGGSGGASTVEPYDEWADPAAGDGGGYSGVEPEAGGEAPLLIAAGGGGAGACDCGWEASGGAGGAAGAPGQNGELDEVPWSYFGGEGAEGGRGGALDGRDGGSGPATGGYVSPDYESGAGGGGGGGYHGGEGARTSTVRPAGNAVTGGGGGGGGSDYCNEVASDGTCSTEAGAGTSHEAGEAANEPKVTLTYTVAAPACTTANGRGEYLRRKDAGHLSLSANLNTEEPLRDHRLQIHEGARGISFHLVKLESSSCIALAGGGLDFTGQGPAMRGRVSGYHLTFSIITKEGLSYFTATVTKGAETITEASAPPLTRSSIVIH
jgi:hypothetical protein